MRASKSITLSLAVTMLLAACGGSGSSATTVALKPKITVSSTSDPTSVMLSEIYAQALEKASFRVARKKVYDTPDALFAAVKAGDVQVTGATAQELYAWVQKQAGSSDPLPASTALQTAAIAKALPATMALGGASTAEDKAVIYCATTFTTANTITSLSDLGTKPQTATLAAPDGFDTATPLGTASLKDTYQIQFKSVVTTAADGILAAVTGGKADCGVGKSGDTALAATTVTVLEDDKALVPNDVMLPLVFKAAGTADVLTVIDGTSTRLTAAELRTLLQRLKDGASPELAANEFTGNGGQ